MLSFSLINEVSVGVDPITGQEYQIKNEFDPISPPKSFFGRSFDQVPDNPSSNLPDKPDKYVRDELGDVIYRNGEPLEKSDIGLQGFMKRMIGPSKYNEIKNGDNYTDLTPLITGELHSAENLNQNFNEAPTFSPPAEEIKLGNIPPEEQM